MKLPRSLLRRLCYFTSVGVLVAPGALVSPNATAADFNGDGHPDYLLWNSFTEQTQIWYLNNNRWIDTKNGPTLPAGGSWLIRGVADFNGDGRPDYLLWNSFTEQTAIWYLNNNVFVSSASGPTLPAGGSWLIVPALY